jgi:hypothetical protein
MPTLAITVNGLRRSGALPSAPFISEVDVTDGGVSVLVVLVISSSTLTHATANALAEGAPNVAA